MIIYFTRHGEAMDDLENKYGGWYDPDLSPAGVEGAKKSALKMKALGINPQAILTSPLKRAVQTAEPIAKVFKLPTETFVYLKERNTYGLLCGENKDQAREKYPELVEAYEKGEEVLGYEPYEFLMKRIKVLFSKLEKMEHNSLVCVTHGKVLGAIFKDFLKIPVKEFKDNCFAEIEIDSSGKLILNQTEGIQLA